LVVTTATTAALRAALPAPPEHRPRAYQSDLRDFSGYLTDRPSPRGRQKPHCLCRASCGRAALRAADVAQKDGLPAGLLQRSGAFVRA